VFITNPLAVPFLDWPNARFETTEYGHVFILLGEDGKVYAKGLELEGDPFCEVVLNGIQNSMEARCYSEGFDFPGAEPINYAHFQIDDSGVLERAIATGQQAVVDELWSRVRMPDRLRQHALA